MIYVELIYELIHRGNLEAFKATDTFTNERKIHDVPITLFLSLTTMIYLDGKMAGNSPGLLISNIPPLIGQWIFVFL